ncbi:uncharacterized protein LOC128556115 [Mercenaria mercenaria]|uniref:uncharacterized protein LOC128556115 n=1 Tax=Mercenaria mercenaria TaxID=6596 RepID=UPI00234E37AC|nr:uncharacterized protein LOC128556115 [Mercenaria mercenaria]
MSSPIFRRLSMHNKNRPFRVVILGQNGVGKSALTVRFLTQRFIGDYAPDLENTYTYNKCIDGETVTMEIRDTAAQASYCFWMKERGQNRNSAKSLIKQNLKIKISRNNIKTFLIYFCRIFDMLIRLLQVEIVIYSVGFWYLSMYIHLLRIENFSCKIYSELSKLTVVFLIYIQVENNRLEVNIKWADAFVLVYSITDRCSFNECSRLKVLINSYARSKKAGGQSASSSVPIVLVGNKSDRTRDRMISTAEGREKAYEMKCVAFNEISVREDRDSAGGIFLNLYKHCKRPGRRSALQQRLSCPPSLQFTPALTEAESANVSSRRRRRALYTISCHMFANANFLGITIVHDDDDYDVIVHDDDADDDDDDDDAKVWLFSNLDEDDYDYDDDDDGGDDGGDGSAPDICSCFSSSISAKEPLMSQKSQFVLDSSHDYFDSDDSEDDSDDDYANDDDASYDDGDSL